MSDQILVILAHPDDETMGCGGMIARRTKAGARVIYVCVTGGQMGRNMGKPAFANRENLSGLRRRELQDACDILGIAEIRWLGVWDKTVEFMDPAVLTQRIQAIIGEINPALIITHYPGHSVHPDHNATGTAVVAAVAALPADQRPPVHCTAFGSGLTDLGPPETVDIHDVRDVKMAALRAHRSQAEPYLAVRAAQAKTDPAAYAEWERTFEQERYWVYEF